jgi:hypothetical protein
MAGRTGTMRAIAPSMPPHTYPRQGRRRPTPRFCAAGAGGVATVETCVSAAAKLQPATRTRRRYIAAGCLATVQIEPVIFTIFRCTSAELFFICCGSVAAQWATAWGPRPSDCDAQQATPRATAPRSSTYGKQRAAPRATAWAPRSSNCGAQRAAPRAMAWAPRSGTCARPWATAWAPQSSTCDAQRGSGLGTTAKYLRKQRAEPRATA